MRNFLLIIFSIGIVFNSYSQDSARVFRKNEVFFELGGNGLLGSINYDRRLTEKPGLGFRVGVGIYGTKPAVTIPLGLNYLKQIKQTRSYLDVGLGFTYSNTNVQLIEVNKRQAGYKAPVESWCFVPSIGLRNITKRHFMSRAQITPLLTPEAGWLPLFGLSLGKRF